MFCYAVTGSRKSLLEARYDIDTTRGQMKKIKYQSEQRRKQRARIDTTQALKPMSNLADENIEMARNMLPVQMSAFASVKPKQIRLDTTTPQPKLPWYAGASDHFGEVKNKYYAGKFFADL